MIGYPGGSVLPAVTCDAEKYTLSFVLGNLSKSTYHGALLMSISGHMASYEAPLETKERSRQRCCYFKRQLHSKLLPINMQRRHIFFKLLNISMGHQITLSMTTSKYNDDLK